MKGIRIRLVSVTEDREEWQRKRDARRKVLAKVRARRLQVIQSRYKTEQK